MGDFIMFEKIFKKLVKCFRKKHNIEILKKVIHDNVYYLCKDDDASLKPLQNKLFINYYDIVEKKQKVVCTYQSRDDLVEYLFRSSYIPYIIDGNPCYNDRYIDGITPYIIKDNHPNLFINLMSKDRFIKCFITKSERNAHGRIISGISDANDFFTTGHSNMCSYMCNWSIFDRFLFITCKPIAILTIIHMYYIILHVFGYVSKSCIAPKTFAYIRKLACLLYTTILNVIS